MIEKIKYKKIAVVIFLTLLIWVWADLALDERLTISNTRINIAKSVNPRIWVSFDSEQFVMVDEFVLKGPASKINYARRAKSDGTLNFDFTFDADQANMIDSGIHRQNTLDFLRESYQVKRLGLMVESCDPAIITVNVVELVPKSLTVQCIDTGDILRNAQSIEPSEVDMYVPESWGRESTALVKLTDVEIRQARTSAIEKTPYILLPDGQIRQAPVSVKVSMPPEEDPLSNVKITNAKLGICMSMSPNMQGKYMVSEISNLSDIIGSIAIKATPQAEEAYKNMRYQVILEIDDSDADGEEKRREVIYNFPERYIREGQIQLGQPAETAQFKLVPLPSADNP